MIPLNEIDLNPYQPRKDIDEEKMQELIQSIKTYGLLQPIVVRKYGQRYQLVAGERRFRALQRLDSKVVPAIVKELSDSALAAVAMIENLQRENLNYIEEAEGYEKLIKEFGLTQEVLAQRLGKSQATIANKLRLLKLSEHVKQRIAISDISERHARALLKLPDAETQLVGLNRIETEGLTVKQTEYIVEEMLNQTAPQDDQQSYQKARNVNEKVDKTFQAPDDCKTLKKSFIRDLKIFINTIHEAVKTMEEAGLTPEYEEHDYQDRVEIFIKLPKNEK